MQKLLDHSPKLLITPLKLPCTLVSCSSKAICEVKAPGKSDLWTATLQVYDHRIRCCLNLSFSCSMFCSSLRMHAWFLSQAFIALVLTHSDSSRCAHCWLPCSLGLLLSSLSPSLSVTFKPICMLLASFLSSSCPCPYIYSYSYWLLLTVLLSLFPVRLATLFYWRYFEHMQQRQCSTIPDNATTCYFCMRAQYTQSEQMDRQIQSDELPLNE